MILVVAAATVVFARPNDCSDVMGSVMVASSMFAGSESM